jgi:hypothetical protein
LEEIPVPANQIRPTPRLSSPLPRLNIAQRNQGAGTSHCGVIETIPHEGRIVNVDPRYSLAR